MSQYWEGFLTAMIHRDYTTWAEAQINLPLDRTSWMNTTVTLLNKVGNHVIQGKPLAVDTTSKLEDSARGRLQSNIAGEMPQALHFRCA